MFRVGTLSDWEWGGRREGLGFPAVLLSPGPSVTQHLLLLRVFPSSAAAGQQSQRGGRPAGWGRELHGDAAAARCRRR